MARGAVRVALLKENQNASKEKSRGKGEGGGKKTILVEKNGRVVPDMLVRLPKPPLHMHVLRCRL